MRRSHYSRRNDRRWPGCSLVVLAVAQASAGELARSEDFGFSGQACADVRSAYIARGKVVDKHLSSGQQAGLWCGSDWTGRVGGHIWSMSSFTDDGQRAPRRMAYNKINYNVNYCCDLAIADGWRLANRVALQWVDYPGYKNGVPLTSEWHVSQALANPYATPYYLLRRAYDPKHWCYWKVGFKRTFPVVSRVSFTIDLFGDLGDSNHWLCLYGPRPDGQDYSDGLAALNLMARMDWMLTDALGIFVTAHQFDIVSSAARETIRASDAPEAKADLFVAYAGCKVVF